MREKSYTFNWHDLDQSEPYEEFVHWVLVNLSVDQKDVDAGRHDGELLEQLRVATDGFTNVVLTVQVNGVEVDVEHWFRSLEHNMKVYAQRAAHDELTQLAEFRRLREDLEVFEASAQHRLNELADELGLDRLDDDEEDR